MPEQQQWLEKQILQCPYDEALTDESNARIQSAYLTAAWPSSPQGLAVKALIGWLEDVQRNAGGGVARCSECLCLSSQGHAQDCPLAKDIPAARKAGI